MSISVCAVCSGTADKAYPVGSFDDFKCPDCGRYSVNRQLLEDMERANRVFHLVRTQQYLATQSRSGQVPTISQLEASIHQLTIDRLQGA
jgi:hypothetical protein